MKNKSLQMKYPGGKAHVAADILRFCPQSFDEFRDPFCGNCPWLFHTDRIPKTMPRWINDMDKWVYNHILWMQDPATDFDDFWQLRNELVDSAEKTKRYFWWATGEISRRNNPPAYLVIRRLAHRQIVRPIRRQNVANIGFAFINNGLANLHREDLFEARDILQGVTVTNQDGFSVIEAPVHDGCCFSIIDPPYNIESHKSGLYDHEFEEPDHRRLLRLLSSLDPAKHKFLLTIDRTPLSWELWKLSNRFTVFERPVTHGVSSNRKRAHKIELMVLNYDPVKERLASLRRRIAVLG